ncbi:putative HTH-type transcriptional regulator TrmBL2 [Nanobdella aerobiophila]|uniref:HTH-type transcriptional regulator TrmBL2 n=1 Tax=Nanobdella aerobiophila TaxID=2586965 RepID=A0A915T073_9ARCH|nr:helix-turn-helix domain-containing protein [Nanobdella aerobiophila]BBL45769.1 putative HTH-type transcriptional regulator TrmBL2 [Nanobdella aerobiophila]
MIVNDELVNKVKSSFNLNTYEARIWLALLSKGVATAGELADLADIPRSRAYDVLESLEKKGFVVMKLGKPIKYLAIPPSEVVERVRKRYEEVVNRKVSELEKLKDSPLVGELDSIHKSGAASIDISEKSGALRGQQNIISHLETMLKEAEKQVNIVTTELSFVRDAIVLKPVFMELKERNVTVRIITPIKDENAKYVQELLNYVEIYDAADFRGRIVTIDSEEVMMMLFDEKEIMSSMDVAVWLYAPALAKFLDQLIQTIVPSLPTGQKALIDKKLI